MAAAATTSVSLSLSHSHPPHTNAPSVSSTNSASSSVSFSSLPSSFSTSSSTSASSPSVSTASFMRLSEDDELPMEPPKPALSSLTAVKGGLLTKQGKSVKSWKKRIFILTEDWLYYYVTQSDRTPLGAIYIVGGRVEEELELSKSLKMHCFSVTSPRSFNVKNGKIFQQRRYFLCTNSRQELNDWMAIIATFAKKKRDSSDEFISWFHQNNPRKI